ncbi:MAG TPA: hypothetical protein ENJ18_11090 [Nannocystis exedens]|nr:hypothetical protein [Nannocystis exedens]
MMLDTILVALVFVVGAVLLSKRVRDNRKWRATVTPLASIIGSGFLVIVPLLGNAVGGYAPLAMLVVVILAYLIGAAIRFNIRVAEPLLASAGAEASTLSRLEYVSGIVLGFAYVISVTFYLRLLASFALRGLDFESDLAGKLITTAILVFIGGAGWLRGLDFLERLEEYSVSIKLAIIASLLVGWGIHDASKIGDLGIAATLPAGLDPLYVIRLLAGVLIVVQGFETSRYLGAEYDNELRVLTMRRAQIISALIYVVFVTLALPSFGLLSDVVDETAIIDLSGSVAAVLPAMLVIAAIMSQLSAAVADTVGSGGLFAQGIGKRFGLSAKAGYVLVASVGVVLVWATNIFEIISLASRAFATYYALQCLVALAAALRCAPGGRRTAQIWVFGLLAALLFAAAVLAIPAG